MKIEGRGRGFHQKTQKDRTTSTLNSTEFKAMTTILSFRASQTDAPTNKEGSWHTDPSIQKFTICYTAVGWRKKALNPRKSLGLLWVLSCNFSKNSLTEVKQPRDPIPGDKCTKPDIWGQYGASFGQGRHGNWWINTFSSYLLWMILRYGLKWIKP